jgi:hypothetical protein
MLTILMTLAAVTITASATWTVLNLFVADSDEE